MKIQKIYIAHLRNSEHFQFLIEFIKLIVKFGAEMLKIADLHSRFALLLEKEDAALKKIMKSALTAEIQAADKRRDRLFRVMIDSNKATLVHFDDEVQAAAKRLKIVFDTYGNLAQKPLNEASADIYNLLQDLNLKYTADIEKAGLTAWVRELGSANATFSNLIDNRYEETAMRTDLVLKECRQNVDEVYLAIVDRINAYVVIEGDTKYAEFIRNFNAVIEKYNEALMHRHHAKPKKEEIN